MHLDVGGRQCSIILRLNLSLLMGLCPWAVDFTTVYSFFLYVGEIGELEVYKALVKIFPFVMENIRGLFQ